MSLHRQVTESVHLAHVAGIFSHSQRPPRIGSPSSAFHALDAEFSRELPYVPANDIRLNWFGSVFGWNPALWRLRMKFKSAPVYFDIEFFLQSDQTGPLRDVAERSNKV